MVRGEEIKKEVTMAKKFEDMNEAEKKVAFDTWVANRTARRGLSANRRKALQALIKAHQPEYDSLLVKFGAKAAAKAE